MTGERKRRPPRKRQETYNDKLARIRRKASSLAERHGMAQGYRSGLEFKTGKILTDLGIEFQFEEEKLIWTPLPEPHKYTPDFKIITHSGKTIYIETKGRFMPDDMAKHLAVKWQHPDKEVRFVFQGSHKWYRKAVRSSYAKWCEKNGFKFCDFKDFQEVIKEWIKE